MRRTDQQNHWFHIGVVGRMTSEIKKLKERLVELESGIQEQAKIALRYCADEQKAGYAGVIYWVYDGVEDPLIPVKAIAEVLGMRVGEVAEFVGPLKVGICEDCGAPLHQKTRTTNPGCSQECWRVGNKESLEARDRQTASWKQRLDELKAMPYDEYLLTPEWATSRKRALKRAGYGCQLCGRDGELHVHHNSYDRLGQEANRDLLALCAECHRKHHDIVEA